MAPIPTESGMATTVAHGSAGASIVTPQSSPVPGVVVTAPVPARHADVLGPPALRFVALLARRFERRRQELLAARRERQREIREGMEPDFPAEERRLREREWTVAPIPADLLDRRVEITGPVDRKMIINALNSGASAFMADFEDAHAPTWTGTVEGQVNLRDAVRGTIAYDGPDGRAYRLGERTATLMVRPRGWHLDEKHVLVDGAPVSASLFDFGLFLFHNAEALLARGTGPYFYLPKLESHLEARLWSDVFAAAQDELGLPRGTLRATVLIETITAAFEADAILWELREHAAGLNCGRWDYIFSYIKKFRHRPDRVLPDRATVTMERPFLKAYVDHVIATCHRRGIHAMGGMAAQIPNRRDRAANEAALERVRADKLREVLAGHDGTWVAHPGLVPVAREVFDAHLRTPHQIARRHDRPPVTPADLLAAPGGAITAGGLRTNVDVGIRYLESWLRGTGCVPIHGLMEDAATAEISRAQVWQWMAHGARLADGRVVTAGLVRDTVAAVLDELARSLGPEAFQAGRFELAARLFEQVATCEEFPEFLTLVAYDHLD